MTCKADCKREGRVCRCVPCLGCAAACDALRDGARTMARSRVALEEIRSVLLVVTGERDLAQARERDTLTGFDGLQKQHRKVCEERDTALRDLAEVRATLVVVNAQTVFP